jgi:1-aminocyclopropane-1-carboxylate deaminase/D-cysteine desulfhydrase-like pyridoxal-dependent ACC family enzyme
MQCELVLPRMVPRSSEEYEQSGNMLLDRLLGARLRVLPAGQDPGGVLERVAEELRAEGRKPGAGAVRLSRRFLSPASRKQ